MGVWKILFSIGLGMAFLLAAVAFTGTSMLEVLAALNAAIGMGIIALLAVIIEKISKPKYPRRAYASAPPPGTGGALFVRRPASASAHGPDGGTSAAPRCSASAAGRGR